MRSDDLERWQEEDSERFIERGDIITPSRGEQLSMVTGLIPAESEQEFLAVDLACGAGSLSGAVLARFPRSRVLALDGSATMLMEAQRRLGAFGKRVEFGEFDLFDAAWLDRLPAPPLCFLSSLAIHHLDADQKKRLFGRLYERLLPGGALLVVDVVEPANQYAWTAYGDAWDAAVREQSIATTRDLEAYQSFAAGWNHYRSPDIEFDKPSGLFEQLQWLQEIGFRQVDCFWLRAGHALYGGYR